MGKVKLSTIILVLLWALIRVYPKIDNYIPPPTPTIEPTPIVKPTSVKLAPPPATPVPAVTPKKGGLDVAKVQAYLTEAAKPSTPIVTAGESNVNIRSGPGTNYSIVGKLLAGQSLEIMGRNADSSWWQVSTSSGLGWVAASVTTAYNIDNGISVVEVPSAPAVQGETPTPAVQECMPWTMAGLHVGETTCVWGTVTSTYNSGEAFFINFSEVDYSVFYGVSFDYTWDNLMGRCIVLHGLIETYEGRPEIIIRQPSQITMCE